MQYPEDNAEQVKLMQALFKSPLWKTMPFEVHFAAREWFQKDVMTPGEVAWIDAADPALVCKDLLALIESDGQGAKRHAAGQEEGQEEADGRQPKPGGESDPEQAAEDVPAAMAALQSTIDGLRKSPVRIEVPEAALENLAALDPAVFADAKAQELMLQLIDQLKAAPPAANFGYRLHRGR